MAKTKLEEILRAELLVHDLDEERPDMDSSPSFFENLQDKLPGFGRKKK